MGSSTRVAASGAQSAEIRSSAASSIGAVRKLNEDSFLVHPPVYLVADGMGGHAHGDLASQTAVKAFTVLAQGSPAATDTVLDAISSANRDVRALSAEDATELAVAGSTLAGMAVVEMDASGSLGWMVFNVGDSRVYSWQDDELRQITVDHSAVQELVANGSITVAEAEEHPERNVITRALGVDPIVAADVWVLPMGGKQVFLACSDGLTKELDDAAISAVIRQSYDEDSFEGLADRLISAAVDSGGADNITIVVVESTWADATTGARRPDFLEDTIPRD